MGGGSPYAWPVRGWGGFPLVPGVGGLGLYTIGEWDFGCVRGDYLYFSEALLA